MKKSDLSTIDIETPEIPPELYEAVAATQEAFSRVGVSVVEAGAAFAAAALWPGVIDEYMRQSMIQLAVEGPETAARLDLLGISLTDYWAALAERQAQQRAQLILLLAFILLTMLVGLL